MSGDRPAIASLEGCLTGQPQRLLRAQVLASVDEDDDE